MLTFLLYTVVFWFAGGCILWLFNLMIQPDGALDVVFGWQKMLAKLYNGSKWQQLLGKALGDCPQCTAFWFMPFWYGVYVLFMNVVIGYWITTSIGGNIVWYIVFHAIGAVAGFVFIIAKMRKKSAS